MFENMVQTLTQLQVLSAADGDKSSDKFQSLLSRGQTKTLFEQYQQDEHRLDHSYFKTLKITDPALKCVLQILFVLHYGQGSVERQLA